MALAVGSSQRCEACSVITDEKCIEQWCDKEEIIETMTVIFLISEATGITCAEAHRYLA